MRVSEEMKGGNRGKVWEGYDHTQKKGSPSNQHRKCRQGGLPLNQTKNERRESYPARRRGPSSIIIHKSRLKPNRHLRTTLGKRRRKRQIPRGVCRHPSKRGGTAVKRSPSTNSLKRLKVFKKDVDANIYLEQRRTVAWSERLGEKNKGRHN